MKMRRRLMALTAAVLAVLLISQLWAAAAGLDLARPCTLTVNPCDAQADSEMAEELSEADIVMDLYQVADWEVSESSYRFVPVGSFQVPQEPTNESWLQAARQAAQIVLQPTVQEPFLKDIPSGEAASVAPGLYLVVTHERNAEAYVETVTDEAGDPTLVTRVKSERYQYTFAPELVAVPSKLPENGEINTANSDDWIYDVTVNLKPERSERKGELEIVKTLLSYDTSGPATFVFQIDWELEGEVHSDVRALTFDAPGERSLLVKELPVGAAVTVTEVYSGVHYTIVGSSVQKTEITAEEPARVSFVNDYDDNTPPNGGGAVVNRFFYSDGEWQWEQLGDNRTQE